MYASMLTNHVDGCYGNHAIFHSAIVSIVEKKNLSISVVPMNDLAPMKNCLGGKKVYQISSRVT